MIKNRKIFISDPWIIKEYISEKPGEYAKKAELLIIYRVNELGKSSFHFNAKELEDFCADYILEPEKLIKGFYDLLPMKYRINGHSIMPYKSIVRKEDGIHVTLDEKIINHFYNPSVQLVS